MIVYDSKAAQAIERSYQTPEIIRQRLQTLDALALCAGERVLDAGCGTGLLVEKIAGIIGSQGLVVGIDNSADMLAFAHQRCLNITQVELHQDSIEKISNQQAQSFDAVSCTQVLLYVEQVEAAIGEFYRLLKPGGRIAIVETDWRGLVLNSLDDKMTDVILGAWDDVVASPNLPVKLTPLLRKMKFSAIKTQAIPIVTTSYTDNSFAAGMLKNFAHNAVKKQVISDADSKQWLRQFAELGQQGAFFFCINRFLFSAVKVFDQASGKG